MTAPFSFEDQRIRAWHEIVQHTAFVPCFKEDGPLLDAMLARLDALVALDRELSDDIARAEQVRYHQYEHFDAHEEHLGPCVLVADLPRLGIEVTP